MSTPKKLPAEDAGASSTVFRDTLYTSRVLILPDGRQLTVAQGRVSADAGDIAAREYLSKHPDLLQE
ncbi:hypothetical protein EX349_29190 [Pseudomonas protegens]|uniref:hypothetical protein n=1 Tax=Pseudomonas protegens TaxID=380021 RepID=UPI001372DD10|nr:hypothetical protein [Pseudomonas protegens]NAN55270.1 hypothetical protein [Pseudomonas protegens]NUE77293.1 hypothetical protein [Pseudomonas protegens]